MGLKKKHSINGALLVLINGISGRNCNAINHEIGYAPYYRIVYFWACRIIYTFFIGRARNCRQNDEVLNLDPIYFAHGSHPIVKVDRKVPRVTVLVVSGSRLEAMSKIYFLDFKWMKKGLYIYIKYIYNIFLYI